MKNLGTLYRYELKKIWKRKLTWVVPLALAALMVYVAIGTASPDVKKRQQILRDGAQRMDGQVMDETFFSAMRKTLSQAGEIGDHYNDLYFYAVNADYYYPYYMALELDLDPKTATAEDFYNARRALVERMWAAQELTGEEIAYWSAQEMQVQQPFTFRSTRDGLNACLTVIYGMSTLIPIAVAVCLCGVFSEERRTRTDQMIFSSKHGKGTICLAKLLAGITAALCAAILVICADSATYAILDGWNSSDAAIQIRYLDSSLPITLGQALFMMFGLLLLYGVLCGSATMLVSVWTRNTVAALAVPVVFMIAQAWIQLPGLQAADYLPNQLFNDGYTLCNVRLVGFFGVYLNNIEFAFLLYGIITVFLIALCWLGWRRNALGKS